MMPKYSDNPNLKRKTVTTIDGSKEYRANCRLYKDGYYVKHKDCIEIDGAWYKKSDPSIALDYETNTHFVKSKSYFHAHGIVDFDGDQPIMGFYTKNVSKNTTLYDKNGTKHLCISEEVAMKGECVEDLSNGYFVHTSYLSKMKSASKPVRAVFD